MSKREPSGYAKKQAMGAVPFLYSPALKSLEASAKIGDEHGMWEARISHDRYCTRQFGPMPQVKFDPRLEEGDDI